MSGLQASADVLVCSVSVCTDWLCWSAQFCESIFHAFVRVDGNLAGLRVRDHHQQPQRNQLSHHLQREFFERYERDPHRQPCHQLHVRRLEWSLLRYDGLYSHAHRGGDCDCFLYSTISAKRESHHPLSTGEPFPRSLLWLYAGILGSQWDCGPVFRRTTPVQSGERGRAS
jgi:hypothetical protein